MTGDSGNVINIDSNSLYSQYYCQSVQDGVCVQSTTIYSVGKTEFKQIGVEILSVVSMFCLAIFFLFWLIKGFFRLVFPSKGHLKRY